MKTKYVVTKMLGSQTNIETLSGANETFDKCLDSTAIYEDGERIKSREHIFAGCIPQIKKGMSNRKVYKCSDNGKYITRTGTVIENPDFI